MAERAFWPGQRGEVRPSEGKDLAGIAVITNIEKLQMLTGNITFDIKESYKQKINIKMPPSNKQIDRMKCATDTPAVGRRSCRRRHEGRDCFPFPAVQDGNRASTCDAK
jgi:hypothetical protein